MSVVEPEAPASTHAWEQPEPEVDLAEYGRLALRSWPILVATSILGLTVALTHSYLSTPLYLARTVLNVEREKIIPSDVGAGPSFFEQYNQEFLPTQLELLKSRDIVRTAVRRLRLVPDDVSSTLPDGSASDRASAVAAGVQGGLSVQARGATSLVELSYVDTDPKRAADIVNAVADSYIDWVLESKTLVVGQASQFLGQQIEQLKQEIEDKERQVQEYGRSRDIVSMSPDTNSTLQKLEAVNKDCTAAMIERVAKESRYHEVGNAKPEALAETASAAVASLREQQDRMEREYQQKLHVFKPEWPTMVQLRGDIARGKEQLAEAVQGAVEKVREAAKADYLAAVRREESLKRLLEAQKSEAMSLNGNAIEYNNLRVELAAKRSLMDTLLKRQSETEVKSRLSGVRQGNIRVVERALKPGAPFKPSHRKNGQTGLLGGLCLGFGFVYLRSYLDRSIKTPLDVKTFLHLPTLGVVPALSLAVGRRYGYGIRRIGPAPGAADSEKPVPVELHAHLHPRSTGAESYRAFRTSLLLSRAGGVRSIVIASGLPGEGKTCTAVNLAVVLGQLGKSVLLVDADLHKPRLHDHLDLPNGVGLVSVLAGTADAMTAVQQSKIPGVWVVTAGPTAPNPSGLLASDAMRRFLDSMGERFDYVLLDSPPTLLVADALILGSLTDGVVVCVKGGETPRDQVVKVKERLVLNRIPILGVLINNLRESTAPYGRSGYYAGYADAYAPAYDAAAGRSAGAKRRT